MKTNRAPEPQYRTPPPPMIMTEEEVEEAYLAKVAKIRWNMSEILAYVNNFMVEKLDDKEVDILHALVCEYAHRCLPRTFKKRGRENES